MGAQAIWAAYVDHNVHVVDVALFGRDELVDCLLAVHLHFGHLAQLSLRYQRVPPRLGQLGQDKMTMGEKEGECKRWRATS